MSSGFIPYYTTIQAARMVGGLEALAKSGPTVQPIQESSRTSESGGHKPRPVSRVKGETPFGSREFSGGTGHSSCSIEMHQNALVSCQQMGVRPRAFHPCEFLLSR
jgi:hypothetical protein